MSPRLRPVKKLKIFETTSEAGDAGCLVGVIKILRQDNGHL
ncbi:MAG: hypothetical protein ACI845_001120 [Gammaproteobacteria bacterium]|jgi:hypothetical protein